MIREGHGCDAFYSHGERIERSEGRCTSAATMRFPETPDETNDGSGWHYVCEYHAACNPSQPIPTDASK